MNASNMKWVGIISGISVFAIALVLYVQNNSKQVPLESMASKKSEPLHRVGMAAPIDIEKPSQRGLVSVVNRQYAKSVKDRALAAKEIYRNSVNNEADDVPLKKLKSRGASSLVEQLPQPHQVGFIYPKLISINKDGSSVSFAMQPVSKGVIYQQRLRIAQGEVLFERATPRRKRLPLSPSQRSSIH